MITEGEVQRAMGTRRTTREIQRLKNHVILCGYGRIGSMFCDELERNGESFVVVENSPSRIQVAEEHEHLLIQGDATHENVLVDAGVDRAKSVVTTLPDDAANVFMTLTARNLNEKLYIIARAEYVETKKKLIQAGADRVVLPAAMGALQMAHLITRPSTVELMELVADKDFVHIELDEIAIPNDCRIIGRTVAETATRSQHGLLIIAIKKTDGGIVFNPDADYQFTTDDTLIAMGKTEDIEKFRREYGMGSLDVR